MYLRRKCIACVVGGSHAILCFAATDGGALTRPALVAARSVAWLKMKGGKVEVLVVVGNGVLTRNPYPLTPVLE